MDFIKMMLVLSLLLTGCSTTSIEDEQQKAFPPTMSSILTVNGEDYELQSGGYAWHRRSGLQIETVQTDHLSPYEIAKQLTPIDIRPNEIVLFQVEEKPTLTMYLWNENDRIDEIHPNNQKVTMPSIEGIYVYELFAQWASGHISYTFVVNVTNEKE